MPVEKLALWLATINPNKVRHDLRERVERWRVCEACYGRAGAWNAAAVDDLRRRFAEWREREAMRDMPDGRSLAHRVTTIRRSLIDLTRQFEEIDIEILHAPRPM